MTFVAKVDEALKEPLKRLARALNKLDDAQGPRGRRLSRGRVSNALRQVKEAVDARFPAPARKTVERTHRTPEERVRKLQRDGYVRVDSAVAAWAAVAGVRAVRVEKPDVVGKRPDGSTSRVAGWTNYFLPGWAASAPDPATMKALKAARGKGRKGLLVDLSLKKTA